ncbi:Gamma-glutamyltranspeptidase precursor [Piscirickettsia salmonis]|uniref:gamma-glutamyltransferase n=1 Tax=Piscirickettsia salmonis TaxID=1238 RepID=UPI0012B884D9|nr:gamma-glutamyltransferase [Piscirickettsia salmonis]QGP50674.1 Gamma-glutamyltranspeptidase precursor [Piscirickettsia salmonis]
MQLRLFIISLFVNLWVITFHASFASSPVIQESSERFHPVWAAQGMVASQEALATKVGRDILAQGGNAVDAAVAVGFALAVTLPRAGNLGGGGFMLVWLNKEHKALAINYREKAPLAASANMYLDKEGNVDRHKITQTYLAAGVPGTVAGLTYALKKYGTMPLKQVIAPAIALARQGIRVTPDLASSLIQAKARLEKSPASQAIFFKKNNQNYQAGDLLTQGDLASSLSLIAQQGGRAFYQGKIAKKIVAAMKTHGGLITLADLKKYQVQELEPIVGHYNGYTIYSMPPPSSGGVTLIELLNILSGFPLKDLGLNSAQSIHLLVEAMNLAYRDRNHYLGDPNFVKMPLKRLASMQYADQLRQQIQWSYHTPSSKISAKKFDDPESYQTTHYSIIDKDGNMVANTYTLNYSYGNGHVVPGTGILLNNEMDDFTAKPGVPNGFGLVQGEANAVAPEKRPLSSMTPTLVLNPQGQPLLATGSPGGSRIITTVLQVLLNRFTYGLNIASSVAAPRIHSQLWPDVILYEQGISLGTLFKLQEMGHKLQPVDAMGSAQTVEKSQTRGDYGVADPRRSGALAAGPSEIISKKAV